MQDWAKDPEKDSQAKEKEDEEKEKKIEEDDEETLQKAREWGIPLRRGVLDTTLCNEVCQ
jgi:hypothetical protein